MDRMFLELLGGPARVRFGRTAFRPNADVYYDSRRKAVVVKLELAGIDPDQINLEVEDNTLRVSGTRSDERPADTVYQQMEISYGRFERAVMLPPEVDTTKASAEYCGGYLEIVLPLKPRSARRRVEIVAKDEHEEDQER